MIKLHYTLLRPDLDVYHSLECDSYKTEVHPVTGKFTVYAYLIKGTETRLTHLIAGVVHVHAERP